MPRIHVWYLQQRLYMSAVKAVKNCQEAAHGAWVQKASNGHTFSWQTPELSAECATVKHTHKVKIVSV